MTLAPSTLFHDDPEQGKPSSLLKHAAHLLPAQAPLEVFVHHNTLHAFQHLPFHEALDAAQKKLGAQGYLPEEHYQEAFRRGRISDEDLKTALIHYLTTCTPSTWPQELPPRQELARLLVVHPCEATSRAGLLWEETEHQATTTLATGVERSARERLLRVSGGWFSERLNRGPFGSDTAAVKLEPPSQGRVLWAGSPRQKEVPAGSRRFCAVVGNWSSLTPS